MPLEHREIRFSVEEVTAAVASLVAAQGISPRDRFRGLRLIEENGDISAIITIATRKEGETRDQPLPGAFLCAALLRLSLLAKLPMPRKASKTLVKAGDSLELHLDLETSISLDILQRDSSANPKEPKLPEAPAVDWWVTAPARPSKRAPSAS